MQRSLSTSTGAGQLSLIHLKSKFFEATREERIVQREHKRLLGLHIDKCVTRGDSTAVYVVPKSLSLTFPAYDRIEIALWLVRECRRGGLHACVSKHEPPVICVSGWNEHSWLDDNQPPPLRSTTATTVKRRAPAAANTRKKTTADAAYEVNEQAERKTLSRHLQQRRAQFKLDK